MVEEHFEVSTEVISDATQNQIGFEILLNGKRLRFEFRIDNGHFMNITYMHTVRRSL